LQAGRGPEGCRPAFAQKPAGSHDQIGLRRGSEADVGVITAVRT